MITSTIGDLLDGNLDLVDIEGHHVYMVRDGEVVFYVGKSKDPVERLWSHLGEGRGPFSTLGRLIKLNLPEARQWRIELLTLSDVGIPGIAIKGGVFYSDLDIGKAEKDLIRRYKPCLNVTYNFDSTPLPKRYKDPRGRVKMDLEVTVSDFIPF